MSKNLFLLLVFASISVISYSCSFWGNCVEGKGKIVEENINLDSFSKIELFGSSKVYLKQGETQSVTIKAQANLITLLNQEISDNGWEIKFSECIKSSDPIEIYIVIPSIEEIEIKGSGEVISQGKITSEELELEIKGSGEIILELNTNQLESSIAGSGDIKLKGTAESHDISIKGAGDIAAYDLISVDTDVEIKGSGDVKVNANSSLVVEIYGSGDVYYTGDVKDISTEIKGSGNVSKR